jgi:TonB-dependent receptor
LALARVRFDRRRMSFARSARLVGLLLLAAVLAPRAGAEEAVAAGTIHGLVIDSESSAPVDGVKVTLVLPAASGAPEQEEVRTTGEDGEYEFGEVAPGSYVIKFAKSGYRASTMTNFTVQAGQVNRADFPLPPLPPQASEEMPGFEEFVVEASPMEEILAASRMDSDELINTMSAAEISKFAASDVADALRYVPGVNVVEGQFAIIRGLEDRYSSTLYNSAVVPSPDPDSQSVQLDLFPSDVVTNLVVAKTFAPDLPSNSSGGSINILTNEYPESFEFKLNGGTGFNTNAVNHFLKFDDGSPMGTPTDDWNTAKNDYGFLLGGRTEFAERELRFKVVGASETKFQTALGSVGAHEPVRQKTNFLGDVTQTGGLALGELKLSGGSFDLNESARTQQETGYLALGTDLDTEGNHKLDGTIFYTKKQSQTVQQYENGHIDGFNYDTLAEKSKNGDDILPSDFDGFATTTAWIARSVRASPFEAPSRGSLWSSSFAESSSYDVDRNLVVYQLNGDHRFEFIDGLHLSWAANTSRTNESENVLGTNFRFEPTDTATIPQTFPVTVNELGAGRYWASNGIVSSANEINESQNFGRVDGDYQFSPLTWFTMTLTNGFWYEHAKRDVLSNFLESPSVSGTSQFAIGGDTQLDLGNAIFDQLDSNKKTKQLSGMRDSSSVGDRMIRAWNMGTKLTLWDDLDLLAGGRYESIQIESKNDPFTGGTTFDGSPTIFPSKYLFFDRLDNPAHLEVAVPPKPGTVFNDEILGLRVPINKETGLVDLVSKDEIAGLINGKIDETRILPSVGFTYRALEGLNLRGAYTQTVARPSFREMGFYVSVEPGSDDLIIGNPQLVLSDVDSYDLRAEYVWGEVGDLAAISGFYKTIENPIESIVLRDPSNFEGSSSALYRTFFNNPNKARLAGVELEARKNLGFIPVDFAQYFSLGGNFTYIDATVNRTEAELQRSTAFFGVADKDKKRVQFTSYSKDRRLFGQPEWIANVDLTFDDQDSGTKITLAYFAISDILDAAGSAAINPSGQVQSLTLDRYLDAFGQLNLIASQTIPLRFGGNVTISGNVKNLTNSERRIIYDPDQTSSKVAERSYKLGLDYSLSLSYQLAF